MNERPGWLTTATLVNSIGDGAFYVTSVLFLTRVAGLSATEVGVGLTIGWAAGLLATTPLGGLADRVGRRRAGVALSVVTAVALLGLQLATSWVAFVAVAVLYCCSQSAAGAVRAALLAALTTPAERTATRARLQVAQNAGLAVGAAAGGIALAVDVAAGYRIALGLDAVAFVLAAILLLRLPTVAPTPAQPGTRRLEVLRDRPYAVLAGLNAVMLLYMPLLSVALPLWVVERTAAPAWLVSALFVLNTAGVMLGQVRVARRVTGLATAARIVRSAGVVMLMACAVFAWSGHSSPLGAGLLLVLAALLQVGAEMMSASGSWQIAFDLAPEHRQGQYQGFYATGVPMARMIGPALLTGLVLTLGTIGWFVLGGLFLLAGVLTVPAVAWARRSRPDGPVPAAAPETSRC